MEKTGWPSLPQLVNGGDGMFGEDAASRSRGEQTVGRSGSAGASEHQPSRRPRDYFPLLPLAALVVKLQTLLDELPFTFVATTFQ